MLRSKLFQALAVVSLLALVVGQAEAQGRRGGGGGMTGSTGGGRGAMTGSARPDPAAMLKDALGATDDEMKVLQPKIDKVRTLQQAANVRPAGNFGNFGRGGRGGMTGTTDTPAEQSAVQKAGAALDTLLQNKDSKAEDIKVALKALRDARAAAKVETEKAQKELIEVVTPRQEGVLVMRGMLD